MNQPRIPAGGGPRGGQFAAQAREEAAVSLDAGGTPSTDMDDQLDDALAAVQNPNASPSAIIAATTHSNAQVRATAARHPSAPAVSLDALSTDPDVDVRLGVAGNLRANPETLDRMAAAERDVTVRAAVAGNPSTPGGVIRRLAESGQREVRSPAVEIRRRAASNPSAPQDVLDRLTRDHFGQVRVEAAGNPNASKRALRVAANDKSVLVRAAVALNPSAPRRTVRRLAKKDRVVMLRSGPAAARGGGAEMLSDRMSVIRDSFGTHVEVRPSNKRERP